MRSAGMFVQYTTAFCWHDCLCSELLSICNQPPVDVSHHVCSASSVCVPQASKHASNWSRLLLCRPLLCLSLQAENPLAETSTGGNYIGARLPADLAPKIDALNLHVYSFFNNATGSRIGVHPEHPGSSMNGADFVQADTGTKALHVHVSPLLLTFSYSLVYPC